MITIFGIRHHGPGCARSLLASLERLKPDLVLVEMPMEAESQLHHAAHAAIEPPVALLFHRTESPSIASFYPFASFSPEWNAIRWALQNQVPIRCMDLPAAHMFALKDEHDAPDGAGRPDPFEWFAKADGYSDGERWWNDRVEERRDHAGLFHAILEGVTSLRAELSLPETKETLLREAWMRKCLRAAVKDGFAAIAVVCGAWHAPVLELPIKAAADQELLKNLPKHPVAATWIPWTNDRLTYESGYGAGIRSPGWYEHLWHNPSEPITEWMVQAARVLRKKGLEASSASVIESVRLATSLAGLRGRPRPGLDEVLESMRSVFCFGDALPLDYLKKPLLIGERLGNIPSDFPSLPLRQDIEATQKRLRLKPAASVMHVELDLREDGGRARSIFLHRLLVLNIPWGQKQKANTLGTFKEVWSMTWKPTFSVAIIDASIYGNTIDDASSNKLIAATGADTSLVTIAEHINLALLSSLPRAFGVLLTYLENTAAVSKDLTQLIATVPKLASISRYGDVRRTDSQAVTNLVVGFSVRIHVGLIGACSGIDEAAATQLRTLLVEYSAAVALTEQLSLIEDFRTALHGLSEASGAHPMMRGLAVRLLRDAGWYADGEVSTLLSFALSPGMQPADSAAWLEGFLHGGGAMLVHDGTLLALVATWVGTLSAEYFQSLLPILRRTFSSFTAPERSRIAAAVAQRSGRNTAVPTPASSSNLNRARPAIARVASLFNLPLPS